MRTRVFRIPALLLLAAAAAGAGDQPSAPDIRSFRPSANGFAFVNHFTDSPLPFSFGGLEHKIGAPTVFGLCGGMSFAAADLFLAGQAPPLRTTPPVKGEKLYDYIQQRQLTSLGPRMTLAVRIGRWMGLPDSGPFGTRTLTVEELGGMQALLAKGQPVVLGLVFNHHSANRDASGPAGVPWENHQVLAYDETSSPGLVSFRIYDPNYPKRDDAEIRCLLRISGSVTVGPWGSVRMPLLGVECERAVGARVPTPIRGMFAMPYSSVRPPDPLE
jgi:hypothetical protein